MMRNTLESIGENIKVAVKFGLGVLFIFILVILLSVAFEVVFTISGFALEGRISFICALILMNFVAILATRGDDKQ